MAINDQYKLDLVFKKLGYGVQSTSINKAGYEEGVVSPIPTFDKDIWAETSKIPSQPQEVPNIVSKLWNVELIEDITVPNKVSWLSPYQDIIPPDFGAGYVVEVRDNLGNRIFPGASDFYFDYVSGTLVFPQGASSFTGFTPPFNITCYRYVGKKGMIAEGGVGALAPEEFRILKNVEGGWSESFSHLFIGAGYIRGIRCTGIPTAGQFRIRMYTKNPIDGGKIVYDSGDVENILWDIMEIPYVDASLQQQIYIVIDNFGDTTDFELEIYVLKVN